MGNLTRGVIVSTGLQMAGSNTALTALANIALNAWQFSAYTAWPWPFLERRVTGVALALGATSVSLGVGSGGVTSQIRRIRDPLFVYDSVFSTKVRARVRQLSGGAISDDETINDPTTNRGTPQQFKCRADVTSWGKWSLIPTPVPDKAYLLAIDYLDVPAAAATDGSADSAVPIYPNDRTMIQAVKIFALDYDQRKGEYAQELDVLDAMVKADRMKYGEVPGDNDILGLDSGVFL